jgi:WD40 repeat protein
VARRSLLLVLVVVAGCGGSSTRVIGAGNVHKLIVSGVAQDGVPAVSSLAAPNGKWKLAPAPGSLRLLETRSDATLDELVTRIAAPSAGAWSRDSKTFALGGRGGRVSVWNEFEHRTFDLMGAATPVGALAFSPDSRLLVAAHGRELVFWNLAARKRVDARLLPGVATTLRFSADGRTLFARGASGAWQLTLPR